MIDLPGRFRAATFAGNSVWRSVLGGASVLFARPLFVNLGVGRGVSLQAGINIAGITGTTCIYKYGKQLRARSTLATG